MSETNGMKHIEIGAQDILQSALKIVMDKGDGESVTSFEITVDLLSEFVTGPQQMPTDVAASAFKDVDELVTRTITLVMEDPAVESLVRSTGLLDEIPEGEEVGITDAHLMAALALLKFGPDAEFPGMNEEEE